MVWTSPCLAQIIKKIIKQQQQNKSHIIKLFDNNTVYLFHWHIVIALLGLWPESLNRPDGYFHHAIKCL